MSFVTGHLHSLKVMPLSAYSNRTAYGVDTGMLAEPEWSADTLDDVATEAFRLRLAKLGTDDGAFQETKPVKAYKI